MNEKKGWDKVSADVEQGPVGLFKWIVIFMIPLLVLVGVTKLIFKPISVATERMIVKQSFQYKEGMQQRGAILSANIAELDVLISQSYDQEELEAYRNQKMILTAQLRAITINE